jgi:hypothetical protein
MTISTKLVDRLIRQGKPVLVTTIDRCSAMELPIAREDRAVIFASGAKIERSSIVQMADAEDRKAMGLTY